MDIVAILFIKDIEFESYLKITDYYKIKNQRRQNIKINISAKIFHMGLFFVDLKFESHHKFLTTVLLFHLSDSPIVMKLKTDVD